MGTSELLFPRRVLWLRDFRGAEEIGGERGEEAVEGFPMVGMAVAEEDGSPGLGKLGELAPQTLDFSQGCGFVFRACAGPSADHGIRRPFGSAACIDVFEGFVPPAS